MEIATLLAVWIDSVTELLLTVVGLLLVGIPIGLIVGAPFYLHRSRNRGG